MKKQSFILFLFSLLFIPSALADEFEKKQGIGTLYIELDSLTALDFWESPDDKLPSHFMEVRHDSLYPTLCRFAFDRLKQDSFPNWFTPLVFHVDIENNRLDINCLEENAQYYKTNLVCESGKFLWIQKSKGIKFAPWIDFYRSVASVEYNNDTIALYGKPTLKNQAFLFYPETTSSRIFLTPIEINGVWMKVDIIETNELGDQLRKKSGWIRWRNEKEVLIKFNLMGC